MANITGQGGYKSGWFAAIALLVFGACQPTVEDGPMAIGFYHWQQQLVADSLNHRLLEMSDDSALLVKVCDLVWANNQVEPRAVLEVSESPLEYQLQPVVFVTNEVMLEIGKSPNETQLLQQLVQDLLGLVDRSLAGHLPYRELQIDCDWTRGSAPTYFQFLQLLKTQLPARTSLSATVRLHQWRDHKTQGIPPVDRGILMAYNSGDLHQWGTENSILDTLVSAAYLVAADYSLPLDVALPLYQWGALYRQGELAYLLNDLQAEALADSSRFEALSRLRFRVKKGTYLAGIYCYPDDLIRLESSEAECLQTTAEQLRVVAPFPGQRLLFFRQGGRLAAEADTSFLRRLSQ